MSRSIIRDRAALARDEERRLAVFGTLSAEAERRHSEPVVAGENRLAFQRDRDRILHARAFRRLKHKTQVFVPHVGDHPRTRLTHTLEVGQLGRTITRTLGLNEDLAEAIAMGHDLGHTAFGHTGEKVLSEILRGDNPDVELPSSIVREVGSFKHNYQSVRVVDLLEHRYTRPGLNLSDQVREGILKHTSWKVDYPFPLPDPHGLALDRPCHLEGQAVAVADEIAQQTHDLEDGLRARSVDLESVEQIPVARQVIERIGSAYHDVPGSWSRQNVVIRGLIDLFVTDVVSAAARRIAGFLERHAINHREGFREHGREIAQTTIWFSRETEDLFTGLKEFIYGKIINHPRVNRQDWRARKVIGALFHAYWTDPRNLPVYVLLRARDELGLPYLREVALSQVATIVADRYHASAGFARLIVDHIAGMSDRFALEEYRSLELPNTDQEL